MHNIMVSGAYEACMPLLGIIAMLSCIFRYASVCIGCMSEGSVSRLVVLIESPLCARLPLTTSQQSLGQ